MYEISDWFKGIKEESEAINTFFNHSNTMNFDFDTPSTLTQLHREVIYLVRGVIYNQMDGRDFME